MRETVGDIDLLAVASPSSPVMDRFVGQATVRQILSHGPTRSSVVLESGLQVDLRVIEAPAYGSALVYFTGSRAHTIAIRRLAQRRGLKISEYGVFDGKRRIAGETEESVYRTLGLPLIPPELREDRGEIQAAAKGTLPRLIEAGDLRGDLHAHTRASDGQGSI
jgi:DNA polymerase (family 10)